MDMLPQNIIHALTQIRGHSDISLDDAAIIVIYSHTYPFNEYIETTKKWLLQCYKARKYFRTSIKTRTNDHSSAIRNPGGWAGPAMMIIPMMLKMRERERERECFIGAGVFNGGSTSCISPACNDMNIEYIAADTFSGLPFDSNDLSYRQGQFFSSRESVARHLRTLNADNITYYTGLFSDTLPAIKNKIAGIFLDTDLYDSSYSALEAIKNKIDDNTIFFSDGVSPYTDFDGDVFTPTSPEACAIADFFSDTNYKYSAMHTYTGNLAIFHCNNSQFPNFNRDFYNIYISLLTMLIQGARAQYQYERILTGRNLKKPYAITTALINEFTRQISYRKMG